MKGKWKAIELDPSLFSEEGMEGLVCFEELTNYRLVDSEKAAAQAEKELKKKEKKKAKKRKISEEEEGEGDPAVESKDGEETAEPAKKKPKKKKKKKKQPAKESVQEDGSPTEAANKDIAASEEGTEGEGAEEDTSKDSAIGSEEIVQSKNVKKSKKKKKKQKQQIENDTEKEAGLEHSTAPPAPGKEKPSQDKLEKPPKKQAKNWTRAALSGSQDKNTDVGAWKDLFVPSPVLTALSYLGFGSPTPIQALALPPAIRDRMDILGAAETGKMQSVVLNVKAFIS